MVHRSGAQSSRALTSSAVADENVAPRLRENGMASSAWSGVSAVVGSMGPAWPQPAAGPVTPEVMGTGTCRGRR